jgi:hypothetical protein
MISKEFKDYLEMGFQNIYDSIPWDKEVTFDKVLETHDNLVEAWEYYFLDTDVWYEGYKLICESIGDCYFMFDTDGPEQSMIGYELADLVKGSNDPIILKLDKEFKAWSKKKEIHKDFNEHFEGMFKPSWKSE